MMVATPLPEAADKLPPRPIWPLVPEGFSWTEEENRKLVILARQLNCTVPNAANLLVYFLRYIQDNPRGLAVAQVPDVLAPFPVKWGYKKKRNDFLKLLLDLDFIYVKVNYWAKIRAKKYAPARSGEEVLARLARLQSTVAPSPPPFASGMI